MGMTIAELEKFVQQVRAVGGNDETVVKVATKSGAVKDIDRAQVWHSAGFPIIHLK